jgi:hypothetical protein
VSAQSGYKETISFYERIIYKIISSYWQNHTEREEQHNHIPQKIEDRIQITRDNFFLGKDNLQNIFFILAQSQFTDREEEEQHNNRFLTISGNQIHISYASDMFIGHYHRKGHVHNICKHKSYPYCPQ